MSNVEAAASLFGASDTSANFFSVDNSGGSTDADINASGSATGSLKSDDIFDNSNDSSALFGQGEMGSEASNLFSNDAAPDFLVNSASTDFSHSTTSANNSYGGDGQHASHGNASYDPVNSGNTGGTDAQGQSRDSSQWSGADVSTSYGNYSTATSQGSNVYEPSYSVYPQTNQDSRSYAPTSSYTPTYPAQPASHGYGQQQSPYVPQNAYTPAVTYESTTATSPYDPYKPKAASQPLQTQQPTTVAPSIPTSTSVYDPYAPPTKATVPTTNSYSYSSTYASAAGQTNPPYQTHLSPPPTIPQAYSSPTIMSSASPTIPPPTPQVKNTTPYRPPKLDAYDPPIPATKPPKRPTQQPTPQPRAVSNTYDYYSSTPSVQATETSNTLPPPPPPPRGGRSEYSSPVPGGTAATGASSALQLHTAHPPPPAPPHMNVYQDSATYSYAPPQSNTLHAAPRSPYNAPSDILHNSVEDGNSFELQPGNQPFSSPGTTYSMLSANQSTTARTYHPPGNNGALPPSSAGSRMVDLTKSPLAYATDLETPGERDALNGHVSPPLAHKEVQRVSSPASDRSWARRSVDFGGSKSPAFDRANGARSPWRGENGSQSPIGSPKKGRIVSSPVRMSSPLADNRSVHSASSLKRNSYMGNASPRNSIDAGRSYTPDFSTSHAEAAPYSWENTLTGQEVDPQAEMNGSYQYPEDRSRSPEKGGSESFSQSYGQRPDYSAPTSQNYEPPPRDRSMTNTSAYSAASTSYGGSYVPHQSNQYAPSQTYGAPTYTPSVPVPQPPPAVYDDPTQETAQYLSAPTHSAYAPSPTLLGSNDPLGRASARAPVFSFGFGGKMITCFHSSPGLSTGFDVALSGRRNTNVSMRILHKVVASAVVDGTSASFPGPLFGDPGSPVQGIVRTGGASASAKAKKAKLLSYLSERIEESSQGLGYFGLGSAEHRRAEGKLTLLQLLRVLIEHDGQVNGSPEIETAVRSAILPRLSVQTQDSAAGASAFMTTMATVPFGSSGALSTGHTANRKVAEYTVHASSLDKLQEFLLKGEKKMAYHYALDEKLWAHAMVIASSIDKDAFREVVDEFVKAELCTKDDKVATSPPRMSRQDTVRGVINGRESLRLAYSLYSGQTSTAVQQLALPSRNLATGLPASLPVPQMVNNQATPISPNFPNLATTIPLPAESLSNWHEYAAMLYSGQMGAESSAALTALGDCLLHNDAVEAAHCCYLLSPLSSPIGGHGLPTARINLVGMHAPHKLPSRTALSDAIVLSEIAEYALSLRPPVKGQDPFNGFPHLIAYRLVRACQLAEMGYTSLARRYCEAITASMGSFRMSPYVTPVLIETFSELSKRLLGVPELDKTSSWIPGKIAKPSLDSIGDWLGGRLTKFVAGETEASPASNEDTIAVNGNGGFTGAFSHYSNISSATTSTSPSPAPSLPNSSFSTDPYQRRSGSAMAIRHSPPTQLPTDRASSAMDYRRPNDYKQPPHRITASAGATVTHFAPPRPFSQVMESPEHNSNDRSTGPEDDALAQTANADSEGGWWSSAYGDSNGATPTATTFFKVDESQLPDAESSTSGFISLMDSVTPQFSSSSSSARASPTKASYADDDIEDDLGLGNSRKRSSVTEVEDASEMDTKKENKKEPPKAAEEKKPELKSSTSNSWLGRWWNRGSSNTPGPVKANLGEEVSFYYDKELKRWVNKNASGTASAPAPPPPPPARAQTASPAHSAAQNGNSKPGGNFTPPPPRPATAFESGGAGPPPKKTIPRARSNLVPIEGGESVPPSPAMSASLSAPPPTSRPASSASRRNVRSRYVDVFKDQNA